MQVLDKGFVVLQASLGDDALICDAARVSTGGGRLQSGNRKLIRYLMRHRHTSPFEHVIFRFHVKAPLFVLRQWHRHRTWSYSELSGRYTEMACEFCVPSAGQVRGQSKGNKQGSEKGGLLADAAESFAEDARDTAEKAADDYTFALRGGICREQARMLLPLSLYTSMIATVDLHNLFHFLGLRLPGDAQAEIREYAAAILELIRPVVPLAVEAFEDYRLDAVTLSRAEAEALRTGKEIDTDSKSESIEWEVKREQLKNGRV